MAAAALGFPFTAAQWKELERQAMIYKYMMASMPVPPDLLLPFSTRSSSADPTASCFSKGTLYNLRYGNRDPEPGRCKRTDGKKWRCSRDVAPHQKYCERHMHRGRPRSRKPVEVHPSVEAISNKKTRLHQSPLQTNPTTAPPNNSTFSPLFVGTTSQSKDPLILNGATGQNISKSSYTEPNRVPGWMMDGDIVGTNVVGPQWLHMMDAKRGLAAEEDSIYGTNAASIMQQGYPQEPLNLFSYTDFGPENIHSRNNESHLFLNSNLISLKQPQLSEYPISRGFIDAFSNGDLNTVHNESSVSSSQGNLSPSSLNLSIAMAAGNALDEEMGLSEVTHSVADSDHRHKAKDGPVSWLNFGSGGPLAEVLQPSGIASGSNPTSPYITTANGESISPPATAVSSPSGVLRRALLSHSDSSVCNSPTTIAASSAPPELVAFQWLT